MKIQVLFGILALSLIVLAGCNKQIGDTEKEEVLNRFDGYEWNWNCFIEEIKFTLWEDHITNIEKIGNYWLVWGVSSDREDTTKNVSSDETARVLFVYDKENDEVTSQLKGGEIPENPEIDEKGHITNRLGLMYC